MYNLFPFTGFMYNLCFVVPVLVVELQTRFSSALHCTRVYKKKYLYLICSFRSTSGYTFQTSWWWKVWEYYWALYNKLYFQCCLFPVLYSRWRKIKSCQNDQWSGRIPFQAKKDVWVPCLLISRNCNWKDFGTKGYVVEIIIIIIILY